MRMSISELFLGLGAILRGFLLEPPGAGVWALVLLTVPGGVRQLGLVVEWRWEREEGKVWVIMRMNDRSIESLG